SLRFDHFEVLAVQLVMHLPWLQELATPRIFHRGVGEKTPWLALRPADHQRVDPDRWHLGDAMESLRAREVRRARRVIERGRHQILIDVPAAQDETPEVK